MNASSSVLLEWLDIAHLSTRDQLKYELICRYQDKVSQRLLDEKKALRSKAKRLSSDLMKRVLLGYNPLLRKIKDYPDAWSSSGKYFPVPIVGGKND